MEIDNHPGDEADVESVGKSTGTSADAVTESRRSSRKSKSQTPRTLSPESTRSRRKTNSHPPKAKTPSPEPSPQPSVEVLEDEVDEDEDVVDGDEETFAVEKVVKHRVHKKADVLPSIRWSNK